MHHVICSFEPSNTRTIVFPALCKFHSQLSFSPLPHFFRKYFFPYRPDCCTNFYFEPSNTRATLPHLPVLFADIFSCPACCNFEPTNIPVTFPPLPFYSQSFFPVLLVAVIFILNPQTFQQHFLISSFYSQLFFSRPACCSFEPSNIPAVFSPLPVLFSG